jgi:hypothetical protein
LHNLLNRMIWSPQNMQGVLILLIAVFLLSATGLRRDAVLWGPVLASALIGSSVWVARPVLVALPLYVGLECFRQRREPGRAKKLLVGAATALGLTLARSAPSLLGYAEMSHQHGGGLTVTWPHASDANLGRLLPPGPRANVVDLPWNLLIELGALIVLPLLLGARAWRVAHQPEPLARVARF